MGVRDMGRWVIGVQAHEKMGCTIAVEEEDLRMDTDWSVPVLIKSQRCCELATRSKKSN